MDQSKKRRHYGILIRNINVELSSEEMIYSKRLVACCGSTYN